MSIDSMQKAVPRLLIVDDDTIIAETLSQIAKRKGYDVHCVYDGNQTLSAVAAFNPHVIFLDLVMPGLDGVEVIGILSDNHCAAKIVLLSGMDKRALAMVGNVVKEKQLDLLGSISKPPKIEEIDAILLPLAAAIAAQASKESETVKPSTFGLQLQVQPHRYLQKSDLSETLWLSVSLNWMLDDGLAISIESALTKDVRTNSARGLLVSMLEKSARLKLPKEASDKEFGVCLPLPTMLLNDSELPNFLTEIIAKVNLAPGQIMLEFDESDILGEGANKHDVLSRLKIKGFGIGIVVRKEADQLLSALNRLAIDELIIDMDYGLDHLDMPVDVETEFQYSSLVSMAAKAGVTTSAKNVNSAGQLEFARRCSFLKARGSVLQ